MFISKAFTAVLSACIAIVSAYPEPRACSGDCTAIDPATIRRDDGTYFRFITFDEIRIYKAPALIGPWTYEGAAIPGGSIIDLAGNTGLWAPDVKKVGDQYILYYSVSTAGSQDSAIGYATSPTMEYGSWTDHGSTGISSTDGDEYNAIDPTLLLDPVSGNYYMSFGSYWDGIFIVEMTSDATQVASGATYTNIAQQPNGIHAYEGSNVIYRNGYYYLYISAGRGGNYDTDLPAAGSEYHVLVCRSSSITGPYAGPAGNLCLDGYGGIILASHDYVYGPGGQGFFSDPTYGDIIYYHYADTNISLAKADYQFGWNEIAWSTDGWPTVSS
ncbi:putative extracellular endo-1,5-alpha-L-arabinase [Xylariales sp. PMI_506]|nr:putative extracellular endo-1,5-alpha-L-arabinase [Xylariales sp. PMI_506]